MASVAIFLMSCSLITKRSSDASEEESPFEAILSKIVDFSMTISLTIDLGTLAKAQESDLNKHSVKTEVPIWLSKKEQNGKDDFFF